jgi:hypothetical protein
MDYAIYKKIENYMGYNSTSATKKGAKSSRQARIYLTNKPSERRYRFTARVTPSKVSIANIQYRIHSETSGLYEYNILEHAQVLYMCM